MIYFTRPIMDYDNFRMVLTFLGPTEKVAVIGPIPDLVLYVGHASQAWAECPSQAWAECRAKPCIPLKSHLNPLPLFSLWWEDGITTQWDREKWTVTLPSRSTQATRGILFSLK